QIVRRAAARHVRGVPGFREDIVRETPPVAVTDDRAAEGAAGPVVAGQVEVSGKRATVHLRAGDDVVVVRREADAGHHGAALGERRLHRELVVVAVEILDVLSDDLALEILPGAGADAVASMDGAA